MSNFRSDIATAETFVGRALDALRRESIDTAEANLIAALDHIRGARHEHRRSPEQAYDPTPICVACFKAWDEGRPGKPMFRPEAACPASPGQQQPTSYTSCGYSGPIPGPVGFDHPGINGVHACSAPAIPGRYVRIGDEKRTACATHADVTNEERESALDTLIASGYYREAFMPNGDRVAIHIANERIARGE
jgi:hypothetical protein